MMKIPVAAFFIFLFLFALIWPPPAHAQDSVKSKTKDSVAKALNDSLRWVALKASAKYPLIRNSEWSMVLPVKNIREKPDPELKYKLLMNLTQWSGDSVSIKKVADGIAEIGRIINLHAEAGIPPKNLDVVIVVHAAALNAFLRNEVYLAKFKTNNPNLDIIRQFLGLHAQLIACGQAELYLDIPAEKLIPELRTALSAQVVLSTYQLKGYVLYTISNENK